jgi:hypothetical protein
LISAINAAVEGVGGAAARGRAEELAEIRRCSSSPGTTRPGYRAAGVEFDGPTSAVDPVGLPGEHREPDSVGLEQPRSSARSWLID